MNTWFALQVLHGDAWLTYRGIFGVSTLPEAEAVARAWGMPSGPRHYTGARVIDLRTEEFATIATEASK